MRRSATMGRPRLLIVDDPENFRLSTRTLLELEGLDVVGLAADGEAALDPVDELEPDVVLLDIQLPGMGGFDVARALAEREVALQVVLISSRGRSEYVRQWGCQQLCRTSWARVEAR